MFERLMRVVKKHEHRLAYIGLAGAYGAGCLGLDKLVVQMVAAGFYAVLAVRG